MKKVWNWRINTSSEEGSEEETEELTQVVKKVWNWRINTSSEEGMKLKN